MRGGLHRRSATKVRGGAALRKNNWSVTPPYPVVGRDRPAVIVERPGRGRFHAVTAADLERFRDVPPDWAELTAGLDVVVLRNADPDALGRCWRRHGVIELVAFPADCCLATDLDFIAEHRPILDALGVPHVADPDLPDDPEAAVLLFDEPSARAFLLLHVFMHELGHHRQHRLRSRSRRRGSHPEDFAEGFANRRFAGLLPAYRRALGDPRRRR